MELIVLNDGFVLVFVLALTVHSSHKLLIIICHYHLPVFNGFWANLIIHDVLNICETFRVLGVKVFVIESVIYEDL